jgi:large subunit ribosomal protein L4
MRRQALASALAGKLLDGEVRLLEGLALEEPTTRVVAELLGRLGCLESCLLVVPGYDPAVVKSVRNLPAVDLRESREVNAYDLLRRRDVIFVGDALERVMERSHGR